MALGCTNPAAANYDPEATGDDGSCIYVNKVGEVCYAFEDVDVEDITEKSFTLSWAVEGDNWVFFHDYIPDFYFSTREQLYTLKDSDIWKHNLGPHGKYYGSTPKSFFIDIVFNSSEEMTVNSVNWLTEAFTTAGVIEENTTITHITMWNSYQCTGRIALSAYLPLSLTGTRKTVSEFSFNEFRDILKVRGGAFLADIFNDYAVDTTKIDTNLPWYDKRLIEDKYVIVRLEFDNSTDKSLSLHASDIDANQSVR